LAAVFFSALYFVSDLMEFAQGGILDGATHAHSRGGGSDSLLRRGVVRAPSTTDRAPWSRRNGCLRVHVRVLHRDGFFALVDGTKDWDALVDRLVPWMTIHGVLMVVAGLAFGLAIVRERVLPRWTGVTLMAGMVFMAASSGLPPLAQTASASIRDLAFAGMGASVLVSRRRRRDVAPPIPVLEVSDVGGRRWAS
jgi:hypothetical protein